MVVLLSHGHHIGDGGAFIAQELRFNVIAIAIQRDRGAFITWAFAFNIIAVLLHQHSKSVTIFCSAELALAEGGR
eukprot:scaffold39070_cov22-Cyclotella_meneghiniana.AAC.1